MDNQLLTELQKKDDDAQIVGEENGYMYIDTSIELEHEIDIALSDPNMLAHEAERPMMDIFKQIARIMFVSVGSFSFVTMTLGFLPYEVLMVDESRQASLILLIVNSILAFIAYVVMTLYRKHEKAPFLLITWYFFHFMTTVSLSSFIRDLSPLQFCMITTVQAFSMFVYTYATNEKVDHWKAFYIQLLVGICAWLMGLYAFTQQRDWITACLLFLATILAAVYSSIQLIHLDRYSMSDKDLVLCVIQYYGDPVIYLYNKIKQ